MAELPKLGSAQSSASVTPPSEDYNFEQIPATSDSSNSNTSSDGSQQHDEAVKMMQNYVHPKMFTIALQSGEHITRKLQAFAEKMQMQSGLITTFIGDVEEITMYFPAKKKMKTYKGPRMVVCGSGNISKYGGRLDVSLANTRGQVTSGELMAAKVALGGSVEIGMLEVAQVQMHRRRVPGQVAQLELTNPAIVWMPLFDEGQVRALEQSRMSEGVQQKPVPVPENISIWPNVDKYDPSKEKDVIFYNNSTGEVNGEESDSDGQSDADEGEGAMSLEEMEGSGKVQVDLGFVGGGSPEPLSRPTSGTGPSLGVGSIDFKSLELNRSDSDSRTMSPECPTSDQGRVSNSPPDAIGLC